MTHHDDVISMRQMHEHAVELVKLLDGLGYAEFIEDRVLQLASARLLEIVGEASSRVSTTSRELHAEIPWRDVIDFRNVIVHAYDSIEYELVWNVVQNDLPDLITELERVLEQRSSD